MGALKIMIRTVGMEDHRNTYKNNRKNRNTRKNKKQKKLSAREHFYARMRMPIGSSSISFPISEDARKDIEKYNKELDERFKNNTYY
jgi:hypothetical protein